MMIEWTSQKRDVIIEVMNARGGIEARTENATTLQYERSPFNDVVYIIVRASDGNVLAKQTCQRCCSRRLTTGA